MSTPDDDAKFEEILEKFIPTPPGAQPRHPSYKALDDALAKLGVPWHGGGEGDGDKREQVFQVIRKTLEDAGIPFLRANGLAEKCYTALRDVL